MNRRRNLAITVLVIVVMLLVIVFFVRKSKDREKISRWQKLDGN